MELLLPLLLTAAPVAGIWEFVARLSRRERLRLASWLQAARHGGLTDLEPRYSFWGVVTLTGRSEDLRVRFEWQERDRGQTGTTILVDGSSLVPLSLRREGAGLYLENRFAPREIQVGDETFDALFYVRGPHMQVRAVLDGQARQRLGALLHEADLEISNGELRAWIPQTRDQQMPDPRLAGVLSRMLGAAQRLRQPADLVQRLAKNARVDRHRGVRLQNLLTLVNGFPDDPATRAALHRACDDQSDEMRVRAATLLGDDGLHTLREVAGDVDTQDEWAARAIAQLGKHLSPGHAKEILGRALHRRHPETARACLAALGQPGWPEGVDVLGRVMRLEQGGELATVAARALGQTGLASAEQPLIKALETGAPDLRAAAAEALGRVGSVAAVLPLKEVEARHEHAAALRRAARQAIAEIHARTGGAPGQLSIATSTAGTLSLVEDERGRLSLERPEQKRTAR
jgi:hypothetical protein